MSEPTEREWLEGLRPEDEREFYLSPDFPTDEDVEVAALQIHQAMPPNHRPYDNCQCPIRARAALLVEADARRTEEKGT